MGDSRTNRGPHPQEEQLFAPGQLPVLERSAGDLVWLLNRGYARESALKLVGDRYQLRARQRIAVSRCVCSDQEFDRRSKKLVCAESLIAKSVCIDGFNLAFEAIIKRVPDAWLINLARDKSGDERG